MTKTIADIIYNLFAYARVGAVLFVGCVMAGVPASAQSRFAGTELSVSASATVATGDYAPLWLTANRYGLGSVRTASAYERATLQRSMDADSSRCWRLGYGLDLALAQGHERVGIVQQAYAEMAWKCLHVTLGAKQQPLETHGSELTMGDLFAGINARPIPQLRIDVDWFTFPGTKGWWKWKLYGTIGFTTDGRWQESWVEPGKPRTGNVLYHEKGLFWNFGRKDVFPLTYEIGLRMGTQFGGTSYNVRTLRVAGGQPQDYVHGHGFKDFWHALIQQGSDATDVSDPNTAGNTVGSYVMQLRYHGHGWQATAYWERMFEDQSMLTVQYGIRDMLIGGEVTLPRNPYVSSAVLEYVTTTNQSGAVYHDRTTSIPDKMNGRDDYYNHLLYAGYQHYGFTLGNPLLTSPLYNGAFDRDHEMKFNNNRVRAVNIGLAGDPTPEWHWRAMASFSRNWGTYSRPLADPHVHQNYFLAEASYRPRWASRWRGTLALGLDQGHIIGNSFGTQLTLQYDILKN